jgi:isopentenyldiphosphate isomerase
MDSKLISKDKLLARIEKAKERIRILGVLAIDLDWDKFKENWSEKIKKREFSVEIICEAECYVNNQSLIASDKRISGEDSSYELESIWKTSLSSLINLQKYLRDSGCDTEPPEDVKKEKKDDYKQYFSLRTCYLQIPIPVINIDNDYYITFTLTKFTDIEKFEQINKEHNWHIEIDKYFKTYFDMPNGARRYSTEKTKADNRTEVIQSYNENRIPMGLLPRDSFLNLDKYHSKAVVWAFIFTRQGELLLHKRSQNAKDNQGMWDKSVGGHISIEDIDSSKAIGREIAEELFTTEYAKQGGHGKIDFTKPNTEKMIFLGEWLPDRRYILPFDDVNNHKDEYYYFRLNYKFSEYSVNSPRLLPDDAGTRDVYVFTDVYVCITAKDFDIEKLQNSKYNMLKLEKIKDMFNEDKNSFSPDLQSVIKSELWKDLSSFATFIQKNVDD